MQTIRRRDSERKLLKIAVHQKFKELMHSSCKQIWRNSNGAVGTQSNTERRRPSITEPWKFKRISYDSITKGCLHWLLLLLGENSHRRKIKPNISKRSLLLTVMHFACQCRHLDQRDLTSVAFILRVSRHVMVGNH